MKKIDLTVIVLTYNQEKYIYETIKSILFQKTNFKYEVLIHDDASTDNTANILRKFKFEYPEKIKLVIQKTNLYSQGVYILNDILYPLAKGRYIALCEGDDFWINSNKLQIQYDIIEKNKNITLVGSSAILISEAGKKIKKDAFQPLKESGELKLDHAIKYGGSLLPTNSLFFRKKDILSMPDYYFLSPVGDKRIIIYLATLGSIYFHNEKLTAYRVLSKNSWSRKMKDNLEFGFKHYTKDFKFFTELNAKLNYKYDNIIMKKLEQLSFYRDLYGYGLNKAILQNKKYFSSLYIKTKIRLFLGFSCNIKRYR